MSNDELYYDALTNLAERVRGGLKNRSKPLDELNQALNQLIGTNTIQGNAADNMKAYIGEVHLPLIQTLQLTLNNFEMALGKYVNGYLEVDSNSGFQLLREDLEAHQRNLSAHRSDFTSLADQLKAISDEAEDIVWLGGAGGYRLTNVANEMDVMKKTASDLLDKWNAYEQHDLGFNQVQDLLARTHDLIKSTLKVPRGYSYSPGSFNNLINPAFLNALEANSNYANDPANQKAFQKDWTNIGKEYTADQKRLREAEAKKQGWDNLGRDVFFLLAGAAITVATGGAGAPLAAALIISSLPSAVDVASDIHQINTGNTTNLAVSWLENRGMDAQTAQNVWTGTSIFAGVLGSGTAYSKLVEVGVAKGAIGEAKPIFKTAFSGSEILTGNPISKAVSVMQENGNVLSSQIMPHFAEGAKLDSYAVKQITIAYGQAAVQGTATQMVNQMVVNPTLNSIFGSNIDDKKTASKAFGLTNISNKLVQPVFGLAR